MQVLSHPQTSSNGTSLHTLAMFARLPAITRSQEYYADRRPELLPNLVVHLGEGQEAVVQVGAGFVLPLTSALPPVT